MKHTLLRMALMSTLISPVACASGGAWQASAREARYVKETQVKKAEDAVGKLSGASREAVDAALATVAAAPATPEGLQSAWDAVQAAARGLADPQSLSSGPGPAIAALREASRCALSGLAHQTGAAVAKGADPVPTAVALVKAVRAMQWSPRETETWLEEEVLHGLGPDLQVATLKALAAG